MTTAEFQELMGAGLTFSSFQDFQNAKEVATRAEERERKRICELLEKKAKELDEDHHPRWSLEAIAKEIMGLP